MAHDDENHAKGENGSSKIYEEGSGMKIHSETHSEYKEHGKNKEHGKSPKHMDEGSSMKMNSEKHGEYTKNIVNMINTEGLPSIWTKRVACAKQHVTTSIVLFFPIDIFRALHNWSAFFG